jgi:uncharacterized membrane protein
MKRASNDGGGRGELFVAAESERLVAAIADAERGNRGEVRVHLEQRCPRGDALERAKRVYAQLGLHQTRDDTAVLLYVALNDRKVAVYAGSGIHGAAEAGFWSIVVDRVAAGFKKGEPVEGLVAALEEIGDLLRTHAAGDDTAGNELSDQVSMA